MFRLFFAFTLFCCLVAPALADDAADKLKANPTVDGINAYMIAKLPKVIEAMQSDDGATADKVLAEMKAVLDELKPEKEDAKRLQDRAKQAVKFYGEQAALAKVTLADLEKQLAASPDDLKVFGQYSQKLQSNIRKALDGKPEEAEAAIKAAKEKMAKIAATSKNEDVKEAAERFPLQLRGIEAQLEGARRLAELVGKQAIPLEVQAWVNGSALTDSDLKGKVVLLDFWAVWCGPCIATFPHLIEWNEKYADKGLVIVGLTNYYKMEWDDSTKRAGRPKDPEKFTNEGEQEMLKKFAAHHKLTHRIAVQPEGAKASEYYAVSGIPHVVLIDRTGKVRMVKVGSGPANAKALHEMIEKLIAEK